MSEEFTKSIYQNILDNIDDLIIITNKNDDKIIKINKSAEKILLENKKIKDNKRNNEGVNERMNEEINDKMNDKINDIINEENIIGSYLSDYFNLNDNKYKYKIVDELEYKTYIIKSESVVDECEHNALIEKECFLFNVSHEIRTPLNGIIGMTQILKDKVDGNLQDYINIISSCGNQLMDILNDILDYAKITSGNISLVPLNFNLTKAIEEIHDIIIAKKSKSNSNSNLNSNSNHNIDITYSIDDNIPDNIFCDLKRLKQILLNLISNGVKFTETGYVKTTIKLIKRMGVKIYIAFIVEDTGIGIPPGYLEKIFQPYIQVNNRISRKYEGTGLGLTISRQLARLLGGDINVKSKVGRGSEFTLIIEAVDPTPYQYQFSEKDTQIINSNSSDGSYVNQYNNSIQILSPNPKTPDITTPKYKDVCCLVIDDNSNNRIMLYQLLSSLGIKSIIIVSSAEEAFLVINSYQFDIIFLDICMPKIDGVKTCIELKKKLPIIPPIIAMSSIDDSVNMIPENLFNDLLLKPIKKSQLIKILDKYIFTYNYNHNHNNHSFSTEINVSI
jgi:signal transduction histidine kinase/CheY-like chemotaxis protein